MTSETVLDVLDAAPAFAEHQPLTGDELRRAGLAALDQVIARLKAAEGDARAIVLEEVSQAAGSIVAAGAIEESFAKALLLDAAAHVGVLKAVGAKQVKSVIAAAIKTGKKSPWVFGIVSSATDPRPRSTEENPSSRTGPSSGPSSQGGRGAHPPSDEDDDGRHRRLAFFPHTDLGNAERFRARFSDLLRWYPAKETWLAWDGKRWCSDRAAEAVKRAEHVTVRCIQDEAAIVRESGRKDIPDAKPGALDFVVEVKRDGTPVLYSDKLARHGRSSEGLNKLGALSRLGGAYMAVSTDELDADKMKINVSNGTLVIARKTDGEEYVSFQPHNPADLITKISPVNFDPNAACPEFDRFLERVQPSKEMRLFLLQWFGLSLTGDISEQKLAYLFGNGSNGKSVLMDSVSYVAGDYGETVPIETFLDSGRARSAGQASPDLAILPGIRMLRTSEPETNAKLAEAMVKLVTGGEPILARHLNRGFFKFYPQFKLTISGNHRPKITGADEGIWRRFQLVPFKVSIPKAERDLGLSEKLVAEASGILNRLLDGLRHWCDEGLIEPDEVKTATAEYRSLSDPLSRFLAACVEVSAGDRVQSSVLYAVFEAWCKSAGESVWKQKGFSLAMDERGYVRKHSDVTWFIDLKLIRSVHDFAGDQQPSHSDGPQDADDIIYV